MATATYRAHRKLSDGSYETVHNETESGVVLRPNGRTVEQDLSQLFDIIYNTDIDGIPFSATFSTLDGVNVTGIWNESNARIEF